MWVILLIALLLFGHRIPGMARSLGSGIVEFKRGLKGGPDNSADAVTSGTTPAQPSQPAQPAQPAPPSEPAQPIQKAPPPEQPPQQSQSQGSSPDQGSANN